MVGLAFPTLPEVCQSPSLGSGGPVVYAAVGQRAGAKELLAAGLLAALARLSPDWGAAPDWGPLKLATGPLGRPLLVLGGRPGPDLSFSAAGGLLWGAMAARGRVGLDAALEAEFALPYPYARAFRPPEWEWAQGQNAGRAGGAAALLWAVKEAAVKALGVGFHTLDPLDLEVGPPSPCRDGLLMTLQVGGAAITAWAKPLPQGWLALAGV